MSETLCTLRTKGGGGGKYTETSLWTNPSPSSAFAAQTVNLSQGMSNYKYLAIKYAYAGTMQTPEYVSKSIILVDDFKKGVDTGTTARPVETLGTTSSTAYGRQVTFVSDTSVAFKTAYAMGTSSTSNNACIPLEILGLNELDHGTMYTY